MHDTEMGIAGLTLMFALGIRHGLDPDHIAAIDNMTYRSLDERPHVASWVGALFALGHGLLVTVIAVAVSLISARLTLPPVFISIAEWIPIALLILVGTLNLRYLLRQAAYHPTGWNSHLLRFGLRHNTHPVAIVLVGVLFAAVFDTATQASAWGYAASSHGGTAMALAIGLAFTAGMIITDAIDGRIMCKLLTRAAASSHSRQYRRMIGWLVVLLSYTVAAYGVARRWVPIVELNEIAYSILGLLLLSLLVVGYMWLQRRDFIASTPTQPQSEYP